MSAATTAPTSRLVSANINEKWRSKNSITETKYIRTLYENFGEGYRLVDFLNLSGQKINIPSGGMSHFEKDAPLRTVKTGSEISTGAAGADITFTLHADNLDANSDHVLREKWDLIIPSTYMPTAVKDDRKYHVTDITGTTVTLSPWNKAGTNATASQISTAIPTDTELAIGASAFEIGSDAPAGTTDSYTSKSHTTRILRETIKIEGRTIAHNYYEATGLNSNKGVKQDGIIRAEFLLENQIERAICDSEPNDNTGLVGTSNFGGSNAIPSFRGALTWMQEDSPKHYYNVSHTLDDFYDIKLLQDNAGVVSLVSDYFMGPDVADQLERAGLDWIKEFSGGTNLYNELSAKLGISFKAFEIGGRTYVPHVLNSFRNPAQGGLNINSTYSYTYPTLGFVIPRERVTVQMTNGMGTQTIPNLSLAVVNWNGENREKIMAIQPGINGFETGSYVANGYDGVSYFWLAEVGIILAGLAKMILVRKAK